MAINKNHRLWRESNGRGRGRDLPLLSSDNRHGVQRLTTVACWTSVKFLTGPARISDQRIFRGGPKEMTGMLAVLFTLQAAVQDPFLVRVDLQALYDQISGMTLSFEQPADVDVLQAVLYTSDYTLVDENGRHWSRIELRDESIRVFQQSPVDWMAQAIRKVSLTADGARALVDTTIARKVTDTEGRFGPQCRTHTRTEVTRFQDEWIRTPTGWKLKARQQVGGAKLS